MADSVVENLILDLLEWLAIRDRAYEEVMEAGRTSRPRLPVWEEANDRGLVMATEVHRLRVIKPTPLGVTLIHERMRKERRASGPALAKCDH